MGKLKEFYLSTKDVAKSLELPSTEYLMVMLAENNLIFANIDGLNYGYNEILRTEGIMNPNGKHKWKWSLESLSFLKSKLKIRTDEDVKNNVITFVEL